MDSLGTTSSGSYLIKSDITFHPNSIPIAKWCKQANENANKQLILNMEKLELEQQKAYQRVEKEQDNLCQKILDNTEQISRLSDNPEPHYAKHVQRSKTTDLRSVYSPLRIATKGTSLQFDEVGYNGRRTKSFKIARASSISSASTNSSRTSSLVSSEQIKVDQARKQVQEEAQPNWQVALAAKRRQKLNQLEMFRELGHWGEDGCQTATAMLTGCSFNPALSSSNVLSHTGEFEAENHEDEGGQSN
ncbi:hypothetical protein Aperf_G00000067880 [Anoplocephala perfoliata]